MNLHETITPPADLPLGDVRSSDRERDAPSLRDQCAIAAMQGMLVLAGDFSDVEELETYINSIPVAAYDLADRMMKARAVPQEKGGES